MRTNRGTTRQDETPVITDRTLLVQAKDDEGFWLNLTECENLKRAIQLAEDWLKDYPSVRVVKGPKREVVRSFGL